MGFCCNCFNTVRILIQLEKSLGSKSPGHFIKNILNTSPSYAVVYPNSVRDFTIPYSILAFKATLVCIHENGEKVAEAV